MSTYFVTVPAPQVTIPPAFDANQVKATLAELAAWDGPWPTFTDETSLRVALDHATLPAQFKKLRQYTERSPALHAAFLRLVPTKHWSTGKNVYDNLTDVFAVIRGLPNKNPHSDELELDAAAEHLTDAELTALFPTLVNKSKRETRYRTDTMARRVAALATSEEHLLRLWAKAGTIPWRLARALSDAQVLQVHAWAVRTERAWRAKKIDYVSTAYRLTWFELLRRNLVTDVLLAEYLDLVATFERDHLRDWCWLPHGSDESFGELTLAAEIEALADAHRHAEAWAPALRSFVAKYTGELRPADLLNEEVLFLLAIAWSTELAPALSALYAAGNDELKRDYNQSEATRDLAKALTGARHGDAMLEVIAKAIKGKKMTEVLAQARARLANRRALIPAVPGATAGEAIQWGRTAVDDAERLLLRFTNPTAAIEAGLRASDPVAVLSAWAAAAGMYLRHKHQSAAAPAPEVALSAQTHLQALETLEQTYGPEQPDRAALDKLIGSRSAAKLFDTAFNAAYTQHDAVWDRAGALYAATKNVRFKEWIEPYLERMNEALIESVPAKLARLVNETAEQATATVERHVVVRTAKAPGAKAVNRLFGPPIGVDAKRWPTRGKTKLEHVITLETRLLSQDARDALGKTTAAVAVFVESIEKGFERGVVVRLTKAQLAKGAKASRGEGSVEKGFALEAITAPIPQRVFQGGKKTGATFELRKLFDRLDILTPDRTSPSWLQGPEGGGTFLFDVDYQFAGELNLGDNGRMFVFDDTALMQCH